MSTQSQVVIIGSTGQLGDALMRAFADERPVGLTHGDICIEDRASVERALADHLAPGGTVLNTAAHNLVDECQKDRAAAFAVNADGPRHVAEIAAERDATVVHFGTDYVFDGAKGEPYIESDPPHPLSIYGESKLAGETHVRAANPRHYILRVATLYGFAPPRKRGENFVEMMLRRARAGEPVRAVDDQTITPTFADAVARQVVRTLEAAPPGLYHCTSGGACTWYDWAVETFRLLAMGVEIGRMAADEFRREAPRPAYSVMENAALQALALDVMPPWQVSLTEYLRARHGLHGDAPAC